MIRHERIRHRLVAAGAFFRDPDRTECEVMAANPDAPDNLRFGTPSARYAPDG